MKFSFTVVIALLLLKVATAQTDSSQLQWKWGISVQFGGYQTDFNHLHKYQYLLNQPDNFSQHVGFTEYFGNRKKLFVGIPVSYSISGVEQGSYNGYTIHASGIYGEAGVSVFYALYKNYSRKFVRGIYPNIGAGYSTVLIKSEAQGEGVVHMDTSFFYEKSRAYAYLFNAGIMFELGNFAKDKNKHDLSIVVGGGYNFQVANPSWAGMPRYREPGDENPDVNLGGLYFYLGITYWRVK